MYLHVIPHKYALCTLECFKELQLKLTFTFCINTGFMFTTHYIAATLSVCHWPSAIETDYISSIYTVLS